MIDPAELAELRALAIDAARAGGRITLEGFGPAQRFDTKTDGSPVTDADRRGEELLRARISDRGGRLAAGGSAVAPSDSSFLALGAKIGLRSSNLR